MEQEKVDAMLEQHEKWSEMTVEKVQENLVNFIQRVTENTGRKPKQEADCDEES